MRTIIRILSLLLALILSLTALVSCARGEDVAEPDSDPPAAQTAAESAAETADTAPAYDGLYLNGVPIKDYTVVFARSAGMMAMGQMVVDAIAEKTGETLKLVNDTNKAENGKEIVVGKTNRTVPRASYQQGEGYILGTSEGRVFIYGADTVCTVKAIRAFEQLLFGLKEGERELSIETKGYADPDTSLVAMSFNVWIQQSSWQERAPAVVSVIKTVCPDTFGVQEADKKWMDYLSEHLPDYAYVGVGRDGGTSGEYSAVFYRTNVFNLLGSGTKWLSDTPDTVSKYDESSLNRIFTYALLQRKSDEKKILCVNTHLDHTSTEAREKQTAVLVNFLNQHKDVPVVVTGDFNATRLGADIKGIFTAGLNTAADLAVRSDGMKATFPGGNKVIDYVFVRANTVDIYEYRVDTSAPNGIQPSDHYPVYIRYDLT